MIALSVWVVCALVVFVLYGRAVKWDAEYVLPVMILIVLGPLVVVCGLFVLLFFTMQRLFR